MKWYSMPIAIVAYAILAVVGFVTIFNSITGEWPSKFWQIIAVIAGVYLIAAFLLSRFRLQWEITVLIEVALVLIPILWFVNDRKPYQPPVFVFLVQSNYTGKLEIRFSDSEKTQIRKMADTLYFPFDIDGRIQLQEDYQMVKTAMRKQCYYLLPDRSRVHIPYAKDSIALDSSRIYLHETDTQVEKGKVKAFLYEIR